MELRRAIRTLRHRALAAVNGAKDRKRIGAMLPFVRHDDLREAAGILRPSHEEYLASVSRADMAVSLELAAFLSALCDWLRPRKIADLGSGYSSFVFRSYAARAGDCEVWSVDDDGDWLRRTRDWLEAQSLATGNLLLWDDFVREPPRGVDLVLHDLGHMALRARVLDEVLRRNENAIVVLDDMHKTDYGSFARGRLKGSPWRCLSLRAFTLDGLGRYSELAFRAPPRPRGGSPDLTVD
jgi:hypothetical protein